MSQQEESVITHQYESSNSNTNEEITVLTK